MNFIPRQVASRIQAAIIETFRIPQESFFNNLPTSSHGYTVSFESYDKDIYTCNIVLTPSHSEPDKDNESPLYVNIECKLRKVAGDKVEHLFREIRFCRISDLAQIPLVLMFIQDATCKLFDYTDSQHSWRESFESPNLKDKVRDLIDLSSFF